MKNIGIIGGIGPQSTELFYKEFIKLCQTRKIVEYPDMLINSINLSRFISSPNNKKSKFDFIKKEIIKIQDFVDFIAFPCNSIHFIIDEIRGFSKVPVVAIHEEVIKEILLSSVKKVGILGTKCTINNAFYQKGLQKDNIGFELLCKEKEEELNSFIFNKILYDRGYHKIHKLLLSNIEIFKKKKCDSVILACTELPLFIKQKDVDIKLFSSTNILVKSVFEKAFE